MYPRWIDRPLTRTMIGSPMTTRRTADDLAIVLTGGGARAAYQVGVLRALGRRIPELRFPIVSGVSAGAINAIYLASHPGALDEAGPGLSRVWERIDMSDVFRVDVRSLAGRVTRAVFGLAGGGSPLAPRLRGLVDTRPLRELLCRVLETDDRVPGISENVEAGHLRALALATVCYGTGQTVQWVEGAEIDTWERPDRVSRLCELGIDHVMASAALPLLFPAVRIGRAWYGDGGIRLAAPLSPAVHLGARRILAISTRYSRSREEAAEPVSHDYPSPAQIAGNLLNAVFLDLLDQDVQRLERTNALLRRLPEDRRGGFRPIRSVLLRPSVDLGRLSAKYEADLPKGFRFLTRSLGTKETPSPDLLSLLMFHPGYLGELMDLGERDAEARAEEIAELVHADPRDD